MKFYKYKQEQYYYNKIRNNKLNAIYSFDYVMFFKNGLSHNNKNAADIIDYSKIFYLNGICYGNNTNFTKQSWRIFVKLQAFL